MRKPLELPRRRRDLRPRVRLLRWLLHRAAVGNVDLPKDRRLLGCRRGLSRRYALLLRRLPNVDRQRAAVPVAGRLQPTRRALRCKRELLLRQLYEGAKRSLSVRRPWLPCRGRSLQRARGLLYRSDLSRRADTVDAMPRQRHLPTERHAVRRTRRMLFATLRSRLHRRPVLRIGVRTGRCAVLRIIRLLRRALRRPAGPHGVCAAARRRRRPYHVRRCGRGLRRDLVAVLQRHVVSIGRQRRDLLRRRPDSLSTSANRLLCAPGPCHHRRCESACDDQRGSIAAIPASVALYSRNP